MNSRTSATFSRSALNADIDHTIMQHQPLVRCLAHQMIAKLAAKVEVDDLINVGMIGLADALARFDAARDVQFENFATTRIRGVMLDELILADEEIQRDRAIGRHSTCKGAEQRCC
jgi:RNA polymerase sigma factor (sigma-70 family)